VPEIPQRAILAGGAAIERELLSGTHYEMSQDSDEALAKAALEAAWPILAEAVAAKILAHMERSAANRRWRGQRAYRRHFTIAARIAAGAFGTEEDVRRLAAQAIEQAYAEALREDSTDGH
jgi:hypothetical protein